MTETTGSGVIGALLPSQRRPLGQPRASSRRGSRHATALLGCVGALFAVAQSVLGPLRFDYGWDETVYLSQVARHVPAAMFTAPRARGVTLLVAPVAAATTSLEAVRIYLVVVSCVGLVLTFRVWLRVLDSWTVVIAALLFASLWQSQTYASEVYPNFWIALLCVATIGWAVRINDGQDSRPRMWMALGLVGITVLRPGDAGWLWLTLVVGSRWHQPWRRARVRTAATVSLAVGLIPWLIEAEARFGGVAHRLVTSSSVEGGLAPHLGVLYEGRSLYGPLLCRPCTRAYHPLVYDVWWLCIPILIAASLYLARTSAQRATLVICSGAATAVALPYLALVGYSAPRFLLPAYALATIPIADGLVRVAHVTERWNRPLVAASLVAATAAFVATQAIATYTITRHSEADRRDNYRLAAAAIQRLGIAQPCLVVGRQSPPIGFEAGCASDGGTPEPSRPEDPLHRALNRGVAVAVLVEPTAPTPTFVQGWASTRVPLKSTALTIYVNHKRDQHQRETVNPTPPRPAAPFRQTRTTG